MRYARDALHAVLCVCVGCLAVRGRSVSRRHIHVCHRDMSSVANVQIDHLKLCVVCINSRRHFCCSECHVVSNVCATHRFALQ